MSLSPELIKKLQAAGMRMSRDHNRRGRRVRVRAEFIEATLPKWIADKKRKRPHCFVDGEQSDIEQAAFGDGNMTARSRLIKTLGQAEAETRAKEWGLKSLTDKSRGERPGGKENQEKPKGDNPWSAEGWNVTGKEGRQR